MDLQFASSRHTQVQEFQRMHHTELVAMLFSDVVGSTKLKQVLGDREAVALLQRHDELMREILGQFEKAQEIATAGDAFFIVFARPSDAVRYSLLVQSALRTLAIQTGRKMFDRIGIHLGEVWVRDDDPAGEPSQLYGLQVDACARVASLGEGDQILLTRAAFDSARQVLKREELNEIGQLSWLDHGLYLLKGVDDSIEIFEVGETGLANLTRPKDTEKVARVVSPDSEPVLGWRPAVDQQVPNTSWVLQRQLGEGGFGEVWLGQEKTLKTSQVFKFCFRADRVRSLKREVTLFRLLKERIGSHPNIVGIKEVNFDEPPFYIVMDYVEGEVDLVSWCEERGGAGNLELQMKLEIVAQVADALQAAQGAGIIHRDIKPSNILVRRDNASSAGIHVRLTDFGIGQVLSQELLAGLTRAGFTQTMASPGSPGQAGTQIYMAPELMAGKPASTGSDIYALGIVLYQLLAGDLSLPLTMDWKSRISDPLLSDDLDRCFAGDPYKRFAGAGLLSANLRSLDNRRVAAEQEQTAIAARATRRFHWSMLRTAMVASPLLAALTGWALYYNEDPAMAYDFAAAYHIPMYAFICIVSAFYFGITGGARAVFRDRSSLTGNARLKVEPRSYLPRRCGVLSLFIAMQCALFVMVGNKVLQIRGMFWEYFYYAFLTGFCGITLGLLIAALVRSKGAATRITWLLMIPQLIFSGAFIKYEEMNRDLDMIATFKRWMTRHPNAHGHYNVGSSLQIPMISRFVVTHYSYEALIVAQAKRNPLTLRQDRIMEQMDALVARRARTETEAARLEDLKEALALLSGLEARSPQEMARKLAHIDAVLEGQPLDAGLLQRKPWTFSAERLYTNQKVSGLVAKAETEQNDFRLQTAVNPFFSPEKQFNLDFFRSRRPLKLSIHTYATTMLLGNALAVLCLLYLILRKRSMKAFVESD